MDETQPHPETMQRLRQQGYRITPQRLEVLRVVSAHEQHLTAEEIHAAVRAQQPAVDIATIYRTLQWLQDVGLVALIDSADSNRRYEYHPAGNHHHHLVCHVCGKTAQIPAEYITALRNALCEHYGFALDVHLALPGQCHDCSRLPNPATS